MSNIYTRVRAGVAFAAASMIAAAMVPCAVFAQVTVGSLADELADRDSLTVFPTGSGVYTQHQASSHDPRNAAGLSRLGAPWGSLNVDFGNYIRQEVNDGRQELVLFEDSGPGAITRWWTTGISSRLLNNNNFRIYIDGSSSPAYSGSGSNLVSGNNNGFGSSLNFPTPERGGNTYGPITYSSGVKVTWDGPTTHDGSANVLDYVNGGGTRNLVNNAVWYNINYRKYEPGTRVESYTGESTTTYASQLRNVNTRLSSNAVHGHVGATDTQSGQSIANNTSLTRNYTAPSGARNGQAIREITLKFNGGSGARQRAALEGTFVELTFDGQVTARVPAGQFFGNGWSENNANVYNEVDDYFRSVAADGTMTSRWVMPYQNDAQVRLVNESGQTVSVDLKVKTGEYTWTNESMHFHADYREDLEVKTRTKPGGPWPGNAAKGELYSAEGDGDFRFTDIRGKGVFVGDTMSIRNVSTGGGLNGWWGEGDEKIYVDYLDAHGNGSNSNPVHLGTGTEDYYGYSFGSGTPFGSPFITQPIATAQGDRSINNLTVNGRVRGLDAITFNESFKFDMEIWKWRQGDLHFGAATFYYGAPGTATMHVAAELATDFKRRIADGISDGALAQNIEDTAGDGTWTFFSSEAAQNGSDDDDNVTLTWGNVGSAGNQGFGGGENDTGSMNLNLGAISDQYVFPNAGSNIGIQDKPGYHELAVHPAGSGIYGNGPVEREYLVMRWEAGDSSEGLININGSIRNLVDSPLGTVNSIDFFIYVDGVELFRVDSTGKTLEETYFDFDAKIDEGQFVDFVVWSDGDGIADESLLRATILALGDRTNSVTLIPGDTDGDGAVDDSDLGTE